MARKKVTVGPELMGQLTKEFSSESDRAVGVLCAAYLDHLLGELIVINMDVERTVAEKLLFKDVYAPLQSFSARMHVTYCLGLIDETQHKNLNLIRKVRNAFAHQLVDLSFEDENISKLCRKLSFPAGEIRELSIRDRFIIASVHLMVDITISIQRSESSKGV